MGIQIDPIDRVGPTLRPPGVSVMWQRWAELLFLHWIVPPEQIRPLLPPGLELDTYQGQAYVGLVPFTMTGVRPVVTPSFPPLSNFHETNVRTYVHLQGRNPGVWFFSLDAANSIAVRIARAWYRLPYHYARMKMSKEPGTTLRTGNGQSTITHYTSERLWPGPTPASCNLRYEPTGTPAPATVGTLEHFLAERYILYAYANGRLYDGRVYHTPYPLQQAVLHSLEENMVAAAGLTLPDEPPLVHFAKELRVRIFPLRPVR